MTAKKKVSVRRERKGQGSTIHFRFDKVEFPEVAELLEVESRTQLRERFGIVLDEDEEWPKRMGAYKGRVLALLSTMLKQQTVPGGCNKENGNHLSSERSRVDELRPQMDS